MSAASASDQLADDGSAGGMPAPPSGDIAAVAARSESGEGGGLEQLFSTRRPRDAAAGLSSGLKNIGKGIVGGLAAVSTIILALCVPI